MKKKGRYRHKEILASKQSKERRTVQIEKTDNKNINTIRIVFQKAEIAGLHINPERDSLDEDTYKKYRVEVEAYANWLEKAHGKPIYKSKHTTAEEYLRHLEDQGYSAYRLKPIVHAFHFFSQAVVHEEINEFKGTIKMGNKDKILQDYNDRGLFRKVSESTTLKANKAQTEDVRENLRKSRSPNSKEFVILDRLQNEMGMRVVEALTTKVKNVVVAKNKDGKSIVNINGKGNGWRLNEYRNPETVALIESLVAGKSPDTPLVVIKKRNGNIKSVEASKKLYDAATRRAAKDINEKLFIEEVQRYINEGKTEEEANQKANKTAKSFTNHSKRKHYAQGQIESYINMTEKQLDKIIARRIEWDNKLPPEESAHLKRKYEQTKSNITYHNYKHYIGKRMTKEEFHKWVEDNKRELNKKEKELWLTSVDLGHGRITSVLNYYVTYPFGTKK